MDKVALLFIVLFSVSAVIVATVVISMRKRRREAEEEQRYKAEQEAKQRAEEKDRQRFEETQHKAEEERKRIEEGKRHRAQEEEQRRKTEKELQERAEEELRQLEVEQQREEERGKAENGRRKAEEARKRAEGESQQRKQEAHGKEHLPPSKRGGRPRGLIEQPGREQTPGAKSRSLNPEIVCWNEGWRWIVGIEVPEELETLSVIQNEELLEQDNTDESRYRLKHAEGAVKVAWSGGEKDIPLVGARRNYFIFKMRKGWKGLGRLVRHPTTGYYLAIVPQEWNRDEEVSAHAPDAPQSVQVDGYKAHFFYQEQNTAIGFITANGERIRVESGGPRFQLVGKEIDDASDDRGFLFGGQLPRVQTLNEKGWSDVGVIVVGEEGGGRNRWRTQFVPQADVKEQKLPEEISSRCGGWYFVRIYDNKDNLLESMDFRFLKALNDIRVESSDFLPGLNGYDSVTAQFLHQTDCKAELMDEDIQHALEIRRESDYTIVTIPPKPNCDKTHWILRDGDAEIEVTVLVERIWWAFGVMGVAPTDWVDRLIILSRKDFTAITDKALWVRFPRLRFVRKINVGFDRAKSLPFQVEMDKKEITIPLRDFCDAEEIENRQEESMIMIWVQPERAKLEEAVIAKVLADQPIHMQKQWIGYGRGKTAVAYAVLRQGDSEFIVNGEPVWTYFKRAPRASKRFLRRLLELEEVKPLIEKMGIDVKVVGSQSVTNRQIKAVAHALARALVCYAPGLKRLLKDKGFGGVRVTTFSLHGTQFAGDRHRNS